MKKEQNICDTHASYYTVEYNVILNALNKTEHRPDNEFTADIP